MFVTYIKVITSLVCTFQLHRPPPSVHACNVRTERQKKQTNEEENPEDVLRLICFFNTLNVSSIRRERSIHMFIWAPLGYVHTDSL